MISLHSHDVSYSQGSGLQSVTGVSYKNDYNSLWTIKEQHAAELKDHNQILKCQNIITFLLLI
jgi:dolichyl-phosphate-mannose--protein O-mannosyl transferase